MLLPPASDVATAPVTAVGLIGGYAVARETGVRPLGGVVLVISGGYTARSWVARDGMPAAVGLGLLYIGSFAASHPLAKRVGAWPAVLLLAGLTAGVSHLVSDRVR